MSMPLVMELREVQPEGRLIVGVVAPYDETSYLTPDPKGERIRRGAFAKTIRQRGASIPLLRAHDQSVALGRSRSFREEAAGLIGEFVVNEGDRGDLLLDDCRHGYLGSMSAGWRPVQTARGADGVLEIADAALVEVSMVAVAAYEGAGLLAVRQAAQIMPELPPRPDVNLAPIPPLVYRPR